MTSRIPSTLETILSTTIFLNGRDKAPRTRFFYSMQALQLPTGSTTSLGRMAGFSTPTMISSLQLSMMSATAIHQFLWLYWQITFQLTCTRLKRIQLPMRRSSTSLGLALLTRPIQVEIPSSTTSSSGTKARVHGQLSPLQTFRSTTLLWIIRLIHFKMAALINSEFGP